MCLFCSLEHYFRRYHFNSLNSILTIVLLLHLLSDLIAVLPNFQLLHWLKSRYSGLITIANFWYQKWSFFLLSVESLPSLPLQAILLASEIADAFLFPGVKPPFAQLMLSYHLWVGFKLNSLLKKLHFLSGCKFSPFLNQIILRVLRFFHIKNSALTQIK